MGSKKINEPSIKLKHLGLISTENVDFKPILFDNYRYNRWKFWKIFELVRFTKQLTLKINEVRQMDFKKVDEVEGCLIKRPENIDLISFEAMIEIQQFIEGADTENENIETLISNVIAMACFSANYSKDFDIEGEDYKNFLKAVLNTDLVQMMGLYQWVTVALNESSEYWNKRFEEVNVEDKDYAQAGGNLLNQFNVLNTIKSTANDFNITYKEALQMSYGMTQANSLSKATASFVQHNMEKIIEARMKREQGKKK